MDLLVHGEGLATAALAGPLVRVAAEVAGETRVMVDVPWRTRAAHA